jgi:hypothetical protein
MLDSEVTERNSELIERMEQILHAIYRSAPEFNIAFNGEEPVRIPSLGIADGYELEASEILFWVDRNAYLEEYGAWEESHLLDKHQRAVKLIRESDQLSVFHDLVGAIRRKRIAPFVGAGMSRPSEYPLWGEALNLLVSRIEGADEEEIKAELDEFRYLDAAQCLWETDDSQVKNFIRTKYSESVIPAGGVQGAIKLLPRFSHGCVITTNFDPVIELVVGKGQFEGYMHGMQQGNKFVSKLIKGDRCILKLHGDAEDSDTYVLTKEHYDTAYGSALDFSKPLPRSLRQIFISYSLLFIGCNMEHDRTLDVFKHTCDDGQFDIPDHFAIMPDPVDPAKKASKEARLLQLHIRPIWYPAGEHQLVEDLLALAVDITEDRVRSI